MESYLISALYDLITPDGFITSYTKRSQTEATATILIEDISNVFRGFFLERSMICFNLKSTLAQIGINGTCSTIELSYADRKAIVQVDLKAYGKPAELLLEHLSVGSYIGKLFASDEDRKIRDPDYLLRMFHRSDRLGLPLLYLGNPQNSDHLTLEKKDGYTIAFLSLLPGRLVYDESICGFIPTLAKALRHKKFHLREFLKLLQKLDTQKPNTLTDNEILLVQTRPLHIRTAFAKVRQDLLPEGYHHTSASILEPDTKASGDVYEFFGNSNLPIQTIPIEFFTLEPHREHVFFADRDQLQHCLENSQVLFDAFKTSPAPDHHKTATFIVKGKQLLTLKSNDWITREPSFYEFPGMIYHAEQQSFLVSRYIEQQPFYPFLKAIEDGLITSQGILLSKFFPSPLTKKVLLSDQIHRCLKGIYFEKPSLSFGDFFSHEDRSMLLDLAKFAIPVYWVDKKTEKILQYVAKPLKDSGMFVPLALVDSFIKACSFGIYGSNFFSTEFEQELLVLFSKLENLRHKIDHPLLNKTTPIALITGGGPGVMEMGNRVAKTLGLLSCANIVDFCSKDGSVVNEQFQNSYIDIKMTYRLDRLVERQAEFNLDFPIFLMGGIGTDFEYSLEEVRRKVGSTTPTPILLFGTPNYWEEKISSRFRCNLQSKTIVGSEWVSNCFYCVQTAKQALRIYKQFFSGELRISKTSPVSEKGFITVSGE